MDAEFWHQRWQSNEIGFHEGEANALLAEHFSGTLGKPGNRVFLPFCGKTRDIGWLLSQGYRVAGAELSQLAVDQLFAELGTEPEISKLGKITRYVARGIDVFVGDIFDLSADVLGPVDVIYDRAALVALPREMRRHYVTHLMAITAAAPQFLLTLEYDQAQMDGPPFSVSSEDVHQLYGDHYSLERLVSVDVVGGLKGRHAAGEHLWLLRTE